MGKCLGCYRRVQHFDTKIKLPPGMKAGVQIDKYDRFGNLVQAHAPGVKFIEIRFKGRSLMIDRVMMVSLQRDRSHFRK